MKKAAEENICLKRIMRYSMPKNKCCRALLLCQQAQQELRVA